MRSSCPANQGQVYRTILHQTNRTYWEMGRTSPAKSTPSSTEPCYIKTSITYWEMRRLPLLIEGKCTDPYYTMDALTSKLPQVYRALLHQTKITFWEMRRLPLLTEPMWYRALLHQACPPPLGYPKCTEPDYSKQVEPIEKWGGPTLLIKVQVYRAILHQTSKVYWEIRRHSPAYIPQVYRALLNQTKITDWEMRRPSPDN